MKKTIIISLTLLSFLVGCNSNNNSSTNNNSMTNESKNLNATNSNQSTSSRFDPNKQYTATLRTTEGDIELALNFGETPNTVKNFIDLSDKNFYDNTIFHRIIKGFMIQGGDPKGDGTGGPGYTFDDEPFSGEYTRGTVAMANAGPDTNGSQFFIMHADYPLPKNYVIFGHVTNGLDVMDKIAESEVTLSPSGEMSKPVTPVKITGIEIKEAEINPTNAS